MELTLTAMSSDGRALGRVTGGDPPADPAEPVGGSEPGVSGLDGKVVFVEGGLTGERVAVHLVSDRSRYSEARALRILDPSPVRVDPPCPHVAEGCGGCQWQHVSPDGQLRLKEDVIVSTVRRLGHIDAPPLRPSVRLDPWHYRTSMRLTVVGGRPALRALHSHDPVEVEGCLIAHPCLLDLIGRSWPGARQLTLRCGARTGERLAAISHAGRRDRAVPPPPDDVRSDWFHEMAAGRRWRISARSFFQSRPDGADALVALVLEAAAEMGAPARAADLYSGVGLFAGALAERGWSVTAIEGSGPAIDDARVNLAGDDVTVIKADVNHWRPSPSGKDADRAFELVVADPSRSGLGRDGTATIEALRPERVVLVSCDVASLARDLMLLAGAGFEPVSITPVDMFTHSFHLETVTVLDRR